jgi:transglutaminase-like putative cysteine protease
VIVAESAVDMHPQHAALETLSDGYPLELSDHRLLDFLRYHGPVVFDPRLEELAASLGLDRVDGLAEILARVMKGLRESFRYEKGVTSSTTSVSEMLDAKGGVCQDFAHLAIALYRHMGIPARYVSGYLRKSGESELETHAWCEAFVPSTGWVAIDPTHRQVASEGHIAVGIGRSYADVPPNRGVFRGDASESIKVLVTIEPVSEVPGGLLAPRPSALEVPSFADGAVDHKEEIDYQQEQQQQQQQQ